MKAEISERTRTACAVNGLTAHQPSLPHSSKLLIGSLLTLKRMAVRVCRYEVSRIIVLIIVINMMNY